MPRILLIEDNEPDAFLIQQALKEHGVRASITILEDGEQACNFVEAACKGLVECPDLVILDLNLPKKSGHEVLAKMRSTGACRHVPVVVLSSSLALVDTKQTERLGVVRHIQKPANLDDFINIGAVLKNVLDAGYV